MCQINTDPMKSQMGYLDVVVPPDILDYPTSTDMVVREGSNVTLRCAAVGSPAPAIVWRREAGDNISLQDGEQGGKYEPVLIDNAYKVVMKLSIKVVSLADFGAYKCIAKNSLGETDGTIKLYKLPKSAINSVETVDSKRRNKSRKGSHFYEANDFIDEEMDSNSKRKDLIIGGNRNDDSYEISTTGVSGAVCLKEIIFRNMKTIITVVALLFGWNIKAT
uniref:Ig-like domain-containing protein n=1 Tax=Anopheles merus TaxID=30066 RepID=A0A182VEG9_ANOME